MCIFNELELGAKWSPFTSIKGLHLAVSVLPNLWHRWHQCTLLLTDKQQTWSPGAQLWKRNTIFSPILDENLRHNMKCIACVLNTVLNIKYKALHSFNSTLPLTVTSVPPSRRLRRSRSPECWSGLRLVFTLLLAIHRVLLFSYCLCSI